MVVLCPCRPHPRGDGLVTFSWSLGLHSCSLLSRENFPSANHIAEHTICSTTPEILEEGWRESHNDLACLVLSYCLFSRTQQVRTTTSYRKFLTTLAWWHNDTAPFGAQINYQVLKYVHTASYEFLMKSRNQLNVTRGYETMCMGIWYSMFLLQSCWIWWEFYFTCESIQAFIITQ